MAECGMCGWELGTNAGSCGECAADLQTADVIPLRRRQEPALERQAVPPESGWASWTTTVEQPGLQLWWSTGGGQKPPWPPEAPYDYAANSTGVRLIGVPICPDLLDFAALGEADRWRGRLVRGFFWLLRLWP